MQLTSAALWLQRVRDAERRGELLSAVDLAERGLAEHPEDLNLRHRAVLALARAGATEEAARRFERFGLSRIEDEEVASLGARIAKDQALALAGDAQRGAAAEAARRYSAIFDRTGGYYPAINAATLQLVTGNERPAEALAREALRAIGPDEINTYYGAATEAEAWLLLGDQGAARKALRRAVAALGDDYGALSTTRRQLRLVCGLKQIDSPLLDLLSGPAVAHFCGHVIAVAGTPGRFPAEREPLVASRVREAVEQQSIGYAYGALAAGADIIWAEALLDAGSELHVVLPFARDEFVATSVAASGGEWVRRFETCMARATQVIYATEDAFLGDDSLFRYGAELAMGMALSRARYLDAVAVQLAAWDRGPAHGDAGTAIDVGTWRRDGRQSVIVAIDAAQTPQRGAAPGRRDPVRRAPAPRPVAGKSGRRVVRALLFGDVKGFSRLTDEQLPRFAEHVLGAFARVIARHGDAVESANTWGDAVYVVVRDVDRAAACALDLQSAMGSLDLNTARLPGHLALRLGAHVGPVFPIHDPVIDRLGFMGSHVSRTARIEPVTPPGEVYVTAAFAAAIALNETADVACEYVGHLPAAKDFGQLRMYRLRRLASSVG